MNDSDKRLIVEGAKLCWHVWHKDTEVDGKIHRDQFPKCLKCNTLWGNQLDPLDPADLYGKIIPAFRELIGRFNSSPWASFRHWIANKHECRYLGCMDAIASPPDLAQALLDYFKERKEREDA